MIGFSHPVFVSIEDYLEGEALGPVKHEYLGGPVHAMSGGTNRHNQICGNCFGTLFIQLRGKACQPFHSDTKVKVTFADHVRFYYPDAMVVCQAGPQGEHFQEQAVVIVEVLSESTRRIDVSEKRDAYRAIPSLKVLIFAESEAPAATVYRRKPQGGFALERHAGLDAVLPLPEIGASLPLAELYARVDFA